MEQQVEAVRGLRYTSPVAVTPLTQEQIDRRLTKNFDKTYPVDFYARRSQAWSTIGVIPAGASLRDALLAFQTGQVVGFYNPANGQLVYIGDTDLDQTERFILAHELTHAIDDQHFGLRRLDAIGARCDDEAFTAGLGAIEGSAQYFATQVLIRGSRPTRRSAAAVTAARSRRCRRSSWTCSSGRTTRAWRSSGTSTRRAAPRRWTRR